MELNGFIRSFLWRQKMLVLAKSKKIEDLELEKANYEKIFNLSAGNIQLFLHVMQFQRI